jgi:CheY-like chemotaxis protein
MMPDVDGIELLRFLRGNDAFAAVPVVSECPPGSASSLKSCSDCLHLLVRSVKTRRSVELRPTSATVLRQGDLQQSAVMSANEENDTVFECIRGGAEDYLLKPVTRKEVQHIWQHVWRRQQQLVVPSIPDEASGQGNLSWKPAVAATPHGSGAASAGGCGQCLA